MGAWLRGCRLGTPCARDGRNGVPRWLRVQALHRCRHHAARRAAPRRSRCARVALSPRLSSRQSIRHADHGARAHVPSRGTRARAARGKLLRYHIAPDRRHGRQPQFHEAHLQAVHAHQVLERRHCGRGRCAPDRRQAALRFVPCDAGPRAARHGRERVRAHARARASSGGGLHVDLRRPSLRRARISARRVTRRLALHHRHRPLSLHERDVRARPGRARARALAGDARIHVGAAVRTQGRAHRLRHRLRHRHARGTSRSSGTPARSTASRPTPRCSPTTASALRWSRRSTRRTSSRRALPMRRSARCSRLARHRALPEWTPTAPVPADGGRAACGAIRVEERGTRAHVRHRTVGLADPPRASSWCTTRPAARAARCASSATRSFATIGSATERASFRRGDTLDLGASALRSRGRAEAGARARRSSRGSLASTDGTTTFSTSSRTADISRRSSSGSSSRRSRVTTIRRSPSRAALAVRLRSRSRFSSNKAGAITGLYVGQRLVSAARDRPRVGKSAARGARAPGRGARARGARGLAAGGAQSSAHAGSRGAHRRSTAPSISRCATRRRTISSERSSIRRRARFCSARRPRRSCARIAF